MAVGVQRWRFRDPALEGVWLPSEEQWKYEWTVPINPNEMSSPFGEKNVSVRVTSAVDGRALLFEGQAPPPNWTFGGAILDASHHERLLFWSEKRNRVIIRDHFGREIVCYILSFEATPKRSAGRYWRHDYTVTALVLKKPSAPTVGV